MATSRHGLSALPPASRPDADPEPVDLDGAHALIAAAALAPGQVGRVGLELEHHVIDRARPAAVISWRRLSGALAGLALPRGSRLTVEPGGQVELSSAVFDDVGTAIAALQDDERVLRAALTDAGLGAVTVGVDPLRAPVRVHPGARYAAMARYFGAAGYGRDGAAMMSSTAALQLNLDAGPEAGWADRVARLHLLGPVLLGLAASSPLQAGRPTGWQCSRQAIWQRLDPARCAPFPGRGDPAGAWASFALAAPVMLVPDGDGCRPVCSRVPLVDWVSGARLIAGRRPTAADIQTHLTTLWPPMRLRGWLELRLLDAVPAGHWPGLAAIVATVADDPTAADAAADAATPCEGRWGDAARLGLHDPALRLAAQQLVATALERAARPLQPAVAVWAELLDTGRSLADLLAEQAGRNGPLACLTAEEFA